MSNSPDRKVLFTASTYSHLAHFHRPYLQWFRQQGREVHIACALAPETAPFADRAIDVPFRKRMGAPENFKAAGMLRRLVKEEHYELIATHTTLAAFFTRLALKGLKNRPKLVDMVHGYLFDDGTPALKKRLLLEAERLTAPETDLLLTMNRCDYETAKNYRLGKRIEMIPGVGVDFSRLDSATPEDGAALREQHGIPEDAFVVIYPAEFSERKSQSILIRALALLPEDVTLALPGDGALLDESKALAARLELSGRVIFPGYVTDMAPWYQAADAAVSASRSEGLPFNVMEAMYCNLPVAASAVKGHVDLIEDGMTGLLYPYGDAEECAAQIARLRDSAELRERLAANANANVRRYGLEQAFPAVVAAYGSVAEKERTEVPV